ncbi:MAG: type IV toxin-antitoxin system AbiEi family antitoxin domain-containing protein [Patescibacteria group bacterium]
MNKLPEKINNIPKTYFSLQDLEKVLDMDKNSLKVALSRAVKAGNIIKLTRGIYARPDSDLPREHLAVTLYRPSYISLEYALSYYNILSQQPYAITLITTKRKKELRLQGTPLIYKHINPSLFWGYTQTEDFLLAEPEKAFLDLVYLSLNGYAEFDPEEMDLEALNQQRIKEYLKKFNSQRLNKKIRAVTPRLLS